MRAIVEGDSLLAVVDVELIRHHVLSQDKAVTEALTGNVVQKVVIVLVA